MYYMGFTWVEGYNIPIWQRHWFIKRIQKEIKSAQDQGAEPQTHAAHQNTPEVRQMMGRARAQVPANLRRFT